MQRMLFHFAVALGFAGLTVGCANLGDSARSDGLPSFEELLLAPGRDGSLGVYGGGDTSPQGKGGNGEVGLIYNEAWWDAKLGFAGQYSTGANGVFLGPTLAAHLQLPTRITPFVGAGFFWSLAERTTGELDENWQPITAPEYSSLYPEAGVHLWICDYARLTTAARYHLTSAGRDHDYWTVGCSVALLFPVWGTR